MADKIDAKQAHAFIFPDPHIPEHWKVYPSLTCNDTYEDYGIIVARRVESTKEPKENSEQQKKSVWCVIAGLSGPGLQAAAMKSTEIAMAVPKTKLGHNSPILYAVVTAKVGKRNEPRFADQRKLETDSDPEKSIEWLVKPREWP